MRTIAPIDVLDEAEARRRYTDNDNWFTVARGHGLGPRDVVPDVVVEVDDGGAVFRVRFFTPAGSLWLLYDFKEIAAQLFLYSVKRFEYADDERHRMGDAVLVETYEYSSDGVTRRTLDDKSSSRVEATDVDGVDVAPHWEPIPAFGDWSSIARLDRA